MSRAPDSAGTGIAAGLRAALLLIFLLSPPATASAAAAQPLFAASTPLQVTLSLPLNTLLQSKEEGPYPGTVTVEQDGSTVVLDVAVSTRGHSRLEYCDMPPLKLDFDEEQVADTVFSGQNKLKLVNQCQDDRKYARYLHQEYAIYRAYRALTDEAFQVRMLELTFVDADGWMRDRTRPAFLIEADKRLAARLNARELEIPDVPVGTLDPDVLTRVGLFQYLVGNTDWSVLQGRSDDPCCHNGLLLESPQGRRVVVPYDFDQAGIIAAEYALPAEGLPISQVRERLFRGLCTGPERFALAIAAFNAARGEIAAEFPVAGQLRHGNRRAQRYIDDFYEIVNNPSSLDTEVLATCRGKPAYWE